ncbi:MAG TPA: FAD-dependent oxidoreductase [Microlunatus sp.]|nr:FAD-dependent oxidoreductase [Microlunatus sp.]
MEMDCDVLVVGGGCGGVAAALAATHLGARVVLTESTRWLGGQLTAQAVPPDEHPWVETTGTTARYRRLRDEVRDRYRRTRRLTNRARRDPYLNPGQAWVSALSAEPLEFRAAIEDLLQPARQRGLLTVLLEHRPEDADLDSDRIRSLAFTDLATGDSMIITARSVLDATEEGDVLPLAGCEHVVGAESAATTGEPHALDGPADPTDQQAITWCAALEWRPGEDHTIDRPTSGALNRSQPTPAALRRAQGTPEPYAFWHDYRAGFWPGPQLGWATQEPETGAAMSRPLFDPGERDLWSFRRIRFGGHYTDDVSDVTLVNWPQIDYWLTPLIGVEPADREATLVAARELTLCFVHWLQTEAPRPDGGVGYPGLRLCPEVAGTSDGLAAQAYVRESRRIAAEFTVLETHVGVEARPDADRAAGFGDSVGVGCYRIDLHPSAAGRGYLDIPTYPFEIPLGALIPRRIENLLAAGKCVGATHITNGCFRLQPVEWSIGEAAGTLAAFCAQRAVRASQVRSSPGLLADFQRLLESTGVQLRWPDQLRVQVR